MKLIVLAYHSHCVLGTDYGANDHVAFAQDLRTIVRRGYRIAPLDAIVAALHGVQANGPGREEQRLVALTFDDGPVYDLDDFVHPQLGLQRGLVNIMRDFRGTAEGSRQELHATSFVIASAAGRKIMEGVAEPGDKYLTPNSLDERWWSRGIDTGFLSIANHSWDHLHPRLPSVAHSEQARGDFSKVASVADADAQIAAAGRYINAVTNGRMAPYFAYPFGHFNEFLVRDYFPRRAATLGYRAAFTTEPRSITRADSVWALPRFVCGAHWRAADGLDGILATALPA
jgi:peptidoglycan/xylan/chitin deacetylase (PgdA/CDA1 family)